MNAKNDFKLLVLFALCLAAVIWSIAKGSSPIGLPGLFAIENRTILYIRAMRVTAALIVGSGLAVAGVALQAILRNTLAEPYLLGSSGGAGLGAVASIALGLSVIYMPLSAFLGALLSVALVYNLAGRGGRLSAHSLVLYGVIMSIAFSGVVIFIVSLSPLEALHGVLWWLWGSLEVYDAGLLMTAGALIVISEAVVFIFSQDLNALSLGEEEAAHLGIDIESVKKTIIIATSLITACAISISGMIGFVGLVIPHIARLVVGPNHRILVPASILIGGTFMVVCDTVSRSVFAPVEVPIGVITSLVGAPLFIYLFKRSEKAA